MTETDEKIGMIEGVAAHFGKSVRTVYRWISKGMPILPDGRFDLEQVEGWVKRKRGIIQHPNSGLSQRGPVPISQDTAPLSQDSSLSKDAAHRQAVGNQDALIHGQAGPGSEGIELSQGSMPNKLSETTCACISDFTADLNDDLGFENENLGKDFWDSQSKQYQAQLRRLDYLARKGRLIERKRVEDLFVARVQAVKQGLLSLPWSLPPQLIACRTEGEMAEIIHRAVYGLLDSYARPLPKDIIGEQNDGI